jgi:hypothetical protein
MTRTLCLLVVVLAASAGFARAENNAQFGPPHSAAEERACKGDAHRFCKEDLSDEFRVASCLQEHRDRISQACRAVLDGH